MVEAQMGDSWWAYSKDPKKLGQESELSKLLHPQPPIWASTYIHHIQNKMLTISPSPPINMKLGQIYQGNHDLTMNNLRYKFDCDSLIMYRIFDLSILFQSFKYYIWEPFFLENTWNQLIDGHLDAFISIQ